MPFPVISIDYYRVKPGAEEQFKSILRRHAAALRELEFATNRPFEVFLGSEQNVAGPLFVEIFEWADPLGAPRAHTHPQISAIWEAMGDLCESRGGRPMFEFSSVHAVDLS
ncbi:MAG: hypothetical protein ACR2J5_15170 [Geodermatophilaceae bacterium]|jgi:hypothetical protein